MSEPAQLKRFPRWLSRSVAWFDYGVVLPLLARLPRALERPLTALRGSINWAFDFDWRTLALGHGYVRAATHHAMRAIGNLDAPQSAHIARRMTIRRFISMAREEVDARRLGHLDYGRVRYTIRGLDDLMYAAAAGRGIVLMVAHYDSLYIALVLLARASQLTINLMSSKVIAHEQLPPAIGRHFHVKMQSLSQQLAPGRVVHSEENLHFFVKALRRGEVVVIAGDVGATSSERSQSVDFLGQRRRMASGPPFLAKVSGAPLALFSCRENGTDGFSITISTPTPLENGGLQAAYTELDKLIREQPWRWWAADLYPTFESSAD